MRAKTPMTRDVIVVPPELPLAKAWNVMKRERIRHLPVVRAGALIGMLSDRDVLTRATLDAHGELQVPTDLVVAEAMKATPLQTCEETTHVNDLVTMMTERKIDAIPVVRGVRLVGLVTTTDLLLLLLERDEARPLPFSFELVDPPAASA